MPLHAGSKLGPYEIVSPLGAGGMGEVYRARDARLGREVAVKILPSAFAGDAGRRARFEQEARAAAALNHPNIVGVFDIGEAEGSIYIVSELVPGETLAALIERGPVPVKKLLDFATQAADGMAAAHAARITHRDLKPANIMIAGDGRAKILDFGLARQAPTAPEADDTATLHRTSAGMIVGTANYMSPEQARGGEVDFRSDQFSFGLILYEMVTGKRAFERTEAVQVMSAILTEEPAPLDAKIPAALRWIVERCLAKDPRDRYASTRDLYQDLRHLRDHLSEATVASSTAIAPVAAVRLATWKLPAVFAAGVLCAFAFLFWRAGPSVPDQSAYRFTPFSFEAGGQCCAEWSPDGKSVTYSANTGSGPDQVFLRQLSAPVPIQLTHDTAAALVTGWSADGRHVLFRRVSTDAKEIWAIASVGGEPELAFTLPEKPHYIDAFSPGLRAYATLRAGENGRYGVWIASPPGAPLRKYSPDPFATHAVYNVPQLAFSPDGKQLLLFLNSEKRREEAWLMPYPPDASNPPRQILKTLPTVFTPQFNWMPDNRHIVAAITTGDGPAQLWMADTRSEHRYALTSGTTHRLYPVVSPDGSRIVFVEAIGQRDIVSIDVATAAVHPLIATERMEAMPAWAAHAPLMAYITDRNGPAEIWLHGPGDADRPLITPASPATSLMGPAPSPDGARVIYTVVDAGSGHTNLWMAATAGGAPIRLTNDPSASEFPGSWSPDGAWFVYQAVRDKFDLMKVKTSGEAAPTVLRTDVGDSAASPVWSPAGEWIAYIDNAEKLISPDGGAVRDLGQHHSLALGFSADGKQLYGMRSEHAHVPFYTIDMATGAEKIAGDAGKGNAPGSNLNPALRLSLTPDGKSFVYATAHGTSNLWLLEGFAAKQGVLARLGLR